MDTKSSSSTRPILKSRLHALRLKLGFEQDWYMLLVAGLIGLVMSGVAILFIFPLRFIEHWTGQADRSLMLWLVPTVPILGAILAGLVHYIIPGHGEGPGVTKVMFAVHRKKSRIPASIGLRKWLASTLTIGSGGSAGAEGPIVTIGSVIGSTIGRLLHANPQSTSTLLGCGAAAGLAAVFNAPIAGVFFVLEIILRDFSIRTLTPIVVASVIATAFTQSVLGNETLFATSATLSVEPFTWREIPNYLILGAICGLTAVAFIKGFYSTEKAFSRLKVHPILRPAIGATLLGILGLLYLVLINPDNSLPGFYGNGYPVIIQLLDPEHYFTDSSLTALKPALAFLGVLVLLGVLKGLCTCLTLGSGGAGGMFAPSLLIGASVGGSFGYIVNTLEWAPSASPAHYALVGMAAFVASTTHAPLTAILIVYEITRSHEVILPLMLAAVISTIVARLLYRESIYTVKLTDQGVRIGAMSDLTILHRLSVQDVNLDPAVSVHVNDSAESLLELSERHHVGDFVVVDDDKHYVGMVIYSDLREALVYREAIPLLQVSELMREDLPTVTPEELLDQVMDKFSRYDVHSLTVLSDPKSGAISGLISRSKLMRLYQNELDKD
ncbi:MAG: chloride channel protein [Planctomycetota bacterium]|nr:chloride channel protein [Planctomycetota bacterium]